MWIGGGGVHGAGMGLPRCYAPQFAIPPSNVCCVASYPGSTEDVLIYRELGEVPNVNDKLMHPNLDKARGQYRGQSHS